MPKPFRISTTLAPRASSTGLLTVGTTTTSPALFVPTAAPTVPHGVCIAFHSNATVVNPVWTRIDDPASINIVSEWSIDRGRSYEQDKVKTGTATITITDLSGTLDPTNSTSPIFALAAGSSIDPMRQVSISLQNPVTLAWTSRFRGFVDDFEFEIDEVEKFLRITIQCVDMFAVLARNEVIPDNGRPIGTGGTGSQVHPPVDSAGDVFYEDGNVDDRIRAVLADADVNAAMSVVFSGNVTVQETVYAVRSPFLQLLQDAADAEFPGVANVYVDNLGRVVFHGRFARFDPASVAADAGTDAWDYHAWKVGDAISWTADPTRAPIKTITFNRGMNTIINAAIATPQTILDDAVEGQLVFDAGSLATYGVSSASWENLITKGAKTGPYVNDKNGETRLFAEYYVNNYHAPRTRISTMTFRNPIPNHVAQTAAWAFLCGAEIADTVNVLTHHPGGGGFNEVFYIEGVRTTATPLHGSDRHLVTVEVDVSPQAYFTDNPFS